MRKYWNKVDANHYTIAARFVMHRVKVEHTHMVGGGFPDMVVYDPEAAPKHRHPKLIEAKNPDTAYGRKGLNENQSYLERGGWPIEVAMTEDDVDTLVARWRKRRQPKGGA